MLAARPPLRVVRQTEAVLVVHKPPGLPFHAAGGIGQPGVLGELRAMQADGRLDPQRLYPVHRLDACTSGALVLARSAAAARYLAACFRRRTVVKYYVALSGRPPKKKQGSVVGDMEKR